MAAIQAIAAFGEPCSYTSPDGTSTTINAVFDAPFIQVDDLTGPPINTSRTFVTVRLQDFPTWMFPVQGGQLMARNVTFAVREVRLDGQGMARLLLNVN